MAEQRSGAIAQIFSSPDAGLLGLNFGALTFVAGLTQFSDLQKVVNVRILAGGLCVAFFFALLCAYFTLFGSRAVADAASKINSHFRFDDGISVDIGYDIRTWFKKFATYLLLFVVPGLVVILVFRISSDITAPYEMVLGSKYTKYIEAGCPYSDAMPAPPRGLSANCKKLESSIDDAQTQLDAKAAVPNFLKNVAIFMLVGIYLSLPVFIWGLTKSPPWSDIDAMSSARNLEHEWRERLLKAKSQNLESLRSVSALISLGAFMFAVGTALVNTGVENVSLGLDKSVPPMAAPPSIVRIDSSPIALPPRALDGRVEDPAKTEAPPPPENASNVPQMYVDVPNKITVELAGGQQAAPTNAHSQTEPQQIELKGLDKLRLQIVPDKSRAAIPPQVVVLEGLKGEPGKDGKDGEVIAEECTFWFIKYRCIANPEPKSGSTK